MENKVRVLDIKNTKDNYDLVTIDLSGFDVISNNENNIVLLRKDLKIVAENGREE